jgi:hypothetical protein
MPEVELVGVWGRSHAPSEALASQFGIAAFDDLDALLADVDAVSFAVPPEIQAGLAMRAAEAGKHLLLEKPIATRLADADRLVAVVERRHLAAVTFLMRLFVDQANDLIARAQAGTHTRCDATWSSRALLPGTPFTSSPWRNGENGTLWDLGPHVLSMLIPVLGSVTRIEATRVRKAKFVCRMLHASGAESTVALDQMDETLPRGSLERYVFSGGDGILEGGPFQVEPARSYSAAIRLLITGIGRPDAIGGPGIRPSREIVAVLEAACASIESGGRAVDVPRREGWPLVDR